MLAELARATGLLLPPPPAAALRPRFGALLLGLPGAGKTRVAEALAAASGLPIFRLSAPTLYRSEAGGSEGLVLALVAGAARAARAAGGACVLLEDADTLLPSAPRSALAARVASLLLRAMETTTPLGVAWIALTCRPGAVVGCALAPLRLRAVVEVALPAPEERCAQLVGGVRARLRGLRQSQAAASPQSAIATASVAALLQQRGAARAAAERCPGATRADVAALCAAALAAAEAGEPPAAAWRAAAAASPPSLLAHALGTAPRPSPLRGLHLAPPAAPPWVRAAVGACLLPLALGLSARCPRGLLLTGPPGTGKSELAHALAHAARSRGLANALVLAGTDIVSPVVGSSEASLSGAFAAARALRPCLLVVDHFEALAGRREDAALHQDRLLSVLLTELDGVGGGGGGGGVTLIAVCRSAGQLDDAVLRPGRLDLRVTTALPCAAARRAVLEDVAGGAQRRGSGGSVTAWGAVVDRIVGASEGESHAGVVGRWRGAAMRALRRLAEGGEGGMEVTVEDVESAAAEAF